jgi:hypothetical protein
MDANPGAAADMTLDAATYCHPASPLSGQAAAALVGELMRHLLAAGDGDPGPLATRLEQAVRTYEVEFRGYLNGQGSRPPLELGAVLATVFAELAEAANRLAAGSRVEELEARFQAARRLLTQRLDCAERRSASGALRIA